MSSNCFLEHVFSIFQHFDHQFEFFIQLRESIVLFLLQLLFDFEYVFFKHFCFDEACFNLLLQDILFLNLGVDFVKALTLFICNSMSLVFADYTFGANVYLIILTVVLGLLLWMCKAKLLQLVFLFFLLLSLCLGVHLIVLSNNVHARTYSTEVIHLLLVINVVCNKVFK